MFADIVDSTRLIEQDEQVNAVRIQKLLRAVSAAAGGELGGQLLERRGDGVLMKFTSPTLALRAAGQAHELAAAQSHGLEAPDHLKLRIGIHTARVLADTTAVYGVGVNAAARVTALAQPGETALSAAARDHIVDGLVAQLVDLGDCIVKGSATPLRVYRASVASSDVVPMPASSVSATVGVPTLAVLPFDVQAQSSEDACLGELLAEALIGRLTRSALLRVTSRLSSAAIKTANLPTTQVGTRLHADYLVSGSIRPHAGQLTVYVEVADSRRDLVLWADRRNGSVDDLLSPDSSLAEEVATAIQSHVIDEQLSRLRLQPMPNLNSYTLYLGGLGLMHRQSRSDFDQSRVIFEHLKSRHPRSAIPRAWLGKWHMLKVVQGWSHGVAEEARLAGVEAARALEIEPDNSLCATIQGVVLAYLQHDFKGAQACYDQALLHNPSDALAHLQQAVLSGWLGDAESALTHAQQALQLSPLDPHLYFMHSLAAGACLGAGDHARAEAHALRSIQANCMHVATYKVLAMAQALQGKHSEARRSVERIRLLSPGFTMAQFQRQGPWLAHPRFDDLKHALASAGVPLT